MDGARNGTLLAAALAATLACRTASPPPAGKPAADAPPSFGAQVLEIRDAALNAHDLDTAIAAYAPAVEVIETDTGAVVLRGREEIRAAHARFLEACPKARVDVLDRSYAEGGRFVTDVQRVRCNPAVAVQAFVQYEIDHGSIVRVWKKGSPLFER
jgi:hypothetical protein